MQIKINSFVDNRGVMPSMFVSRVLVGVGWSVRMLVMIALRVLLVVIILLHCRIIVLTIIAIAAAIATTTTTRSSHHNSLFLIQTSTLYRVNNNQVQPLCLSIQLLLPPQHHSLLPAILTTINAPAIPTVKMANYATNKATVDNVPTKAEAALSIKFAAPRQVVM